MQQLALSLALPHSSGCLGRQLWPGLMSKIYFECELKIQGTILPACLADQAMRHYHIKEKCASRDPLGDKRCERSQGLGLDIVGQGKIGIW